MSEPSSSSSYSGGEFGVDWDEPEKEEEFGSGVAARSELVAEEETSLASLQNTEEERGGI